MELLKYSLGLFACLVFYANQSGAQTYHFDPFTAEELRMRDGLPNFFKKVQGKKEVRIAYFGGSITRAKGWRVKTMSWFRNQYPETQFREIDAAISGTGTGFGACRLGTDILPYKPDLLFVEFRVNGGEGVEKQSVEGIVRQIRKANPRTDICFVYTIGNFFSDQIRAGKNTPFGTVMEQVANYYGITTIDLGIEIVRLNDAGTLTIQNDKQAEGMITFSQDGVHPGDEGHQIYADVIARNFLKMDMKYIGATKYKLKPELFENPWELGALIPIENATKSPEWIPVSIKSDTIYGRDFQRTNGMLRGAYKCAEIGGTIEVEWGGTTLGINDLTEMNPVVFEIPKYVLLILSPLLKVDPIDPEEIAKGGFQIGSPGKSYFPLIIGYGD